MSNEIGIIWMVDGKINLNRVGIAADWHRATMIDDLKLLGLDRVDAEAFADFISNEYVCAQPNGVTDHSSEDCVSDAQYDRLSIASSVTGAAL